MENRSYKIFVTLLSLVMFFCAQGVVAQKLIGTTGMMNIPTADMNPSGTFVGGFSYVQKNTLTKHYNYDTGLYYVNFTPFKWAEATFRETLLKTRHPQTGKIGFYQQDRSTSLRLAPLRETEGRWFPGVVIGCNDIYSDHGNSYYTTAYVAVTKHIGVCKAGFAGATIGYAKPFGAGEVYDGLFAGVEFSPRLPIAEKWVKDLKVMAEYDTQSFNFGIQMMLFKHMNAMLMTRKFENVCACLSYQYTIKY